MGTGWMNTSNGEKLVITILNGEGIRFEREKTYRDLKHGLYRFDFYLPDKNILIEYDGENHFKDVFKKGDFRAAQERDRRKNSYALANQIPLYRIPYWEFKTIKTFDDITTDAHRVKNRWHNDFLWQKIKH